MEHFTKLDSSGNPLPIEATDHVAVLDTRTNLIWPRKLHFLGKAPSWAKAVETANSSTICGMPTRAASVEEGFLIADRSKRNPALDTRFFEVDTSDWYWTSTPLAGFESSRAWYVGFGSGYAGDSGQGFEAFVLAVCSARASQ